METDFDLEMKNVMMAIALIKMVATKTALSHMDGHVSSLKLETLAQLFVVMAFYEGTKLVMMAIQQTIKVVHQIVLVLLKVLNVNKMI